MPIEQQLQRALQLANHAREDRIRAQDALHACFRKERETAEAAKALAKQLASQTHS